MNRLLYQILNLLLGIIFVSYFIKHHAFFIYNFVFIYLNKNRINKFLIFIFIHQTLSMNPAD